MSKLYIIISILLLTCQQSHAIDIGASDTTNVLRHTVSLGISIGTTGVGLELGKMLFNNKRFQGRVGATYMQFQKPLTVELNSKSIINIDPDLRFNQFFLAADYYFFRKSAIRGFLGISYLYNFNVSAFIDTNTGIKIDNIEVSPEDFGEINFQIKWNKVAPFIGLGFGRIIPKRRVNFNTEFGVYYMGKPQIKSEYFGVLDITNVDELIPKIEKNIAGYSYLPFMNFKVRVRIGKH